MIQEPIALSSDCVCVSGQGRRGEVCRGENKEEAVHKAVPCNIYCTVLSAKKREDNRLA